MRFLKQDACNYVHTIGYDVIDLVGNDVIALVRQVMFGHHNDNIFFARFKKRYGYTRGIPCIYAHV